MIRFFLGKYSASLAFHACFTFQTEAVGDFLPLQIQLERPCRYNIFRPLVDWLSLETQGP